MNSGGFFPLYPDYLAQFKDEIDRPVTAEEINDLKKNIITLDKQGQDFVYAWVRIHSLRTAKDAKLLEIPYEGSIIETKVCENKDELKTIKFDLRKWPLILCKMVDRFCKVHLDRMKNDEYRASLDISGGTAVRQSK
jgi:hypothetical protein